MVIKREWMLVFGAGGSARDEGERYRVTQRVSPRVVIVSPAHDAMPDELRRATGAEAVLEPGETLAADLRQTLSNAEGLFVDAFAGRSSSKQRRGEGLDWDAEGFAPPDPPPKR